MNPIEPKINETFEYEGQYFRAVKAGALSPLKICKKCAARADLCALVNCVGSTRQDETRICLEAVNGEDV